MGEANQDGPRSRPPFVTEVRVTLTKAPPILAFVTVTLWDALVVHDLRVMERHDGSRVVLMPRVRSADGRWSTIAHPIDEATRIRLESFVLLAYERCLADRSAGQAAS